MRYGDLKYAIFTIDQNKDEVVLDEIGISRKWQDFVEVMLTKKPSYAVYNFEYIDKITNKINNKIITFLWRGSTTGTKAVKEKMLIASTLNTFRNNLELNDRFINYFLCFG